MVKKQKHITNSMCLQDRTFKSTVLSLLSLYSCFSLSLSVLIHFFSEASSEFHQFLECLFELVVERRVDDGIDEGVQVSQPGKYIKKHWIKPALLTYGHDQRADKEREPTDDECAQDDAQCLGCFPLPGSTQTFPLQHAVCQLHFHTVHEQRRSSPSSSTSRGARV